MHGQFKWQSIIISVQLERKSQENFLPGQGFKPVTSRLSCNTNDGKFQTNSLENCSGSFQQTSYFQGWWVGAREERTNINKVFIEPIGNMSDLLAISMPSVFMNLPSSAYYIWGIKFMKNYSNNLPCPPWDHFHILEIFQPLFRSYINIFYRQSERFSTFGTYRQDFLLHDFKIE